MKDGSFKLDWRQSTIFLIAFFGVVYFFAPRAAIDPWGLFHIYKLGMLFWALSVIQFLSVVLLGWIGPRAGSVLGGFLSGLISSTALTLTSSQFSKDHPHLQRIAAISAVSGVLAMIIEAMGICFLSAPEIALSMLPSFVAMIAALIVGLVFLVLRGKSKYEVVAPAKPLNLIDLIKLMSVILSMIAAVGLGRVHFGDSGVKVITAIASIFELHAVLVANLQLFISQSILRSEIEPLILLGVFISCQAKVLFALAMGNRRFSLMVAVIVGLVPFVGIAVHALARL